MIFHSATLNYLPPERRKKFAQVVGELNGVWISHEAIGVISSLREVLGRVRLDRAAFVMGLGLDRPLAFSDPHGEWIQWIGQGKRAPQP